MTNRKVILVAAGLGAVFGFLSGADIGDLQGGDAFAAHMASALGGALGATALAVIALWILALIRRRGEQ